MLVLDLTVNPTSSFYRGCRMINKGGRYFLEREDSASVVVSKNVSDWLKIQPNIYTEAEMKGIAPTSITASVLAVLIKSERFTSIYLTNSRLSQLQVYAKE